MTDSQTLVNGVVEVTHPRSPSTDFVTKLKRNWKWLLSALLLGVGIYALLQADPAALKNVWNQIRTLGLAELALPVGIVLIQVALQISRMWVLFPRKLGVRWPQVGRAVSYGQFINMFVPARAGDFVKVVAITDRHNPSRVQTSDATGVLIADKVTDIVSLLLIVALVGLPIREYFTGKSIPIGSWFIGSVLFVAFLLGILRLILPTLFKGARNWLIRALRGILTLAHPGRLGASLFFGALCWCSEGLAIATLAHGFGVHLTPTQALWTLVALNLGIAIPVSVANVGTFEAAMTFALSRFGVSTIQAISIATVHHAIQVSSVALWAFAFWGKKLVYANRNK